MKTCFYVFIILSCAFFACSDNSKSSEQATDSTTVRTNDPGPRLPLRPAGCYQMTLQRDSATLTVELQDTVVGGTLNYIYYEKDSNLGTISGIWRDSMLYTFYTFRSEGVVSVREMVWKVRTNELLPAIGDVVQRNDTVYYADRSKLQFDDVHPFVKVPCRL